MRPTSDPFTPRRSRDGDDKVVPAEPAAFAEPREPPRRSPEARREAITRRVDAELEQTFPASDPPSWTLGRSRDPS